MRKIQSVLLLSCLILASCSQGDMDEEDPLPSSSQATTPSIPSIAQTSVSGQTSSSGQSAWTSQTSTASDGSVQVTQTRLIDASQGAVRNTYQRVNLNQIPVDPKYNAVIFRVTDETLPDDIYQAFVAPKLFSYGGGRDGHLVSHDNGNGTVTIFFDIAFLDGLVSEVPSPASDWKIPLPEVDLIQNRTELETLLATRFGLNQGIVPLAGCPKKIYLVVGQQEFDATSPELAEGDFCQLNVPIATSLTVSMDLAQWILGIAVPAGLVDIRGIFETRVSFPVANIKMSFDRNALFQSLEAELGGRAWILDVDARAGVSKVLETQLLKVSVQGDLNAMLGALVSKVMDQFFQSVMPIPGNPGTAGCGTAMACLRLSYARDSQDGTLDFQWVQSTNTITGQNYLTSTQLRATGRDP